MQQAYGEDGMGRTRVFVSFHQFNTLRKKKRDFTLN
jgi:hypothetical protein